MTKRHVAWCAIVLTLAVVQPAWTQNLAELDRAPSAPDLDAILASITDGLTTVYIFPDTADAMVRTIREQRAAGAYDGLAYPELAEALTRDLRSVSHDLHLGVRVDRSAQEAAPEGPTDDAERRERLARRGEDNFGFKDVRRLEGNVGYLELTGFTPAEIAGDAGVAAMNLLAGSRALIFDLRGNGGGSPTMIQLLSSYLFEEPVHLNSFSIRRDDRTEQFWTQAHVEGEKMVDVPVFVLTSARTFSAAEEFAYNLKNLGRATLVGETTGGGAHPVERWAVQGFPLAMSLPYGRAVNPITGTNWEGTGVEPHHQVPAENALDVAHRLALEQIAASEDLEAWARPQVEWALVGVRAAAEPFSPPAASLDQYVGRYGPRTIVREGDRLVYQRGDRPPFTLRPLGPDLFALEGIDSFRIRFDRNDAGRVDTLVGLYDSGEEEPSARDGE